MYINSVLSSMGAWREFTEQHPKVFASLEEALTIVEEESFADTGDQAVGRLHQALNRELEQRGWTISTQVRLLGGKQTVYTLDFLKDRIGGKLILGKPAFILSSLLANFPLSMRIQDIDLGFVLVPMQSLKELLPRGVSDFESTGRVLEELAPLLIRYPFLIIGFSSEPFPLDVRELTSELDQFLLTHTQLTLNEMVALGEKPNYDFKAELPEKIEKITKEVCALANTRGGGLLLFGIYDNGDIVGIPAEESDTIQLRITNSVRGLCDPIPELNFHVFECPENPERIILIGQVDELKRKPCLLHHRAYLRSGPSAQPADAEEIRRLVLGGGIELRERVRP